MKIIGGVLALLLAAGSPAHAGLPDASWSSAPTVPRPAPPPAPGAPPALPAFSPAAVPNVSFNGLSLKSVQFSRTDRIPASLIAAIDRTEKTMLLALYDLNLSEVAGAVLRAKARGVDIRLIYDEGHAKAAGPDGSGGPSPEYQSLVDAGVPARLLKGGGSFGIMHHKYAIFDGKLLMTGSFNWTNAADERNFENAQFTADPALIDGFARNWRWMWGLAPSGAGSPPSDPQKPVSFGGARFPRYAFSPQGGVEGLLLDAIRRSKRTIDVAMFSFYSQPVAAALVEARARGVIVRVASDAMQARRSQAMRALADGGVDLRLSAGRGGRGVMHHKYALFDGALLMSGSYNFSANAELYNYESDLFTTSKAEVAAFGGEFAVVWAQSHLPAPEELPAPKSL